MILNKFQNIKSILQRFPLVVLNAFFGTSVAIELIEGHDSELRITLTKLLLIALLGQPSFFLVHLFLERFKTNHLLKFLLPLGTLLLLVSYYFYLPNVLIQNDTIYIQIVLIFLGLHFMVAVLPYYHTQQSRAFWHYNKNLFIAFIKANVFAQILSIGLVIALFAINELLDIKISSDWYSRVWTINFGLINTLWFLTDVPKDFDALELVQKYPKVLKILVQFIFLPLVIIYCFILYAYGLKIMIAGQWPKGTIAWLVSYYSCLGILSMLLFQPYAEQSTIQWHKRLSTYFYATLIPIVFLLLGGVYQRIAAYGITELRYLLMIMGAWLLGISLYFLFKKNASLKMIPISLAVIAFLSSFGPWGASQVSIKNQVMRLQYLLSSKVILVDGKINAQQKVTSAESEQINSQLKYLINRGQISLLQQWFHNSKVAQNSDMSTYNVLNEYMSQMGLQADVSSQIYISLRWPDNFVMPIAGYETLLAYGSKQFPQISNAINSKRVKFDYQNSVYELFYDWPNKQIQFFQGGIVVDKIDFLPMLDQLTQVHKNNIKNGIYVSEFKDLIFDLSGKVFKGKIIITNIYGDVGDFSENRSDLNFMVLLK